MTCRMPSIIAVLALVFGVAAGPASAQTQSPATIGADMSQPVGGTVTCPPGPMCWVMPYASALQQASLTAPYAGEVTSYSVSAVGPGTVHLSVIRPTGPGAFASLDLLSMDAPVPAGSEVSTFATSLPVLQGDALAVVTLDTPVNYASMPLNGIATFTSSLTPQPTAYASNAQLLLSAVVRQVPVLQALNPSRGSQKGGNTVRISGQNLSMVTRVTVGGRTVPIASRSATRISIKMPRSKSGAASAVLLYAGSTQGIAAAGINPNYIYTRSQKG
jgi:hypothetical protein